ncbi:MAG: FUSC family protein [Actinomycetes bacterium]
MRRLYRRTIKLFTDRRAWVRQILVASAACGTAWLVGNTTINSGGVVAAIVCALSIRISLYKSVREGFGQIVGTAIGASVALGTVGIFHLGFIAVATTVLFCSIVARALHLGEVASVNVPVTALIVIGPGISGNTALHRLLSTLVGAGVAIVFSYFSHASTPKGRTEAQIAALGEDCAALLSEMAEGVVTGYDEVTSGKWLAKGRLLIEEIPKLRSQALEAKRYARWSPLEAEGDADALYISGVAIEHTIVQVRTIARALFDAAVSGENFMSGYSELAQALLDTGAAILTKIEYIELHSNINQIDNVAHDLRLGSRLLAEHLFELAGTVNQDQLVRAVSIVGNMERIADSLDESSPALKDVKTPGEPAHMQVLEVNPIQQGKRWRNKVIRFFKVLTGRK